MKAAVFVVAFVPQLVPRGVAVGQGNVLLTLVPALVSRGWHSGLVATGDRAADALEDSTVRCTLTAISATGTLTLAVVVLVASPR